MRSEELMGKMEKRIGSLSGYLYTRTGDFAVDVVLKWRLYENVSEFCDTRPSINWFEKPLLLD